MRVKAAKPVHKTRSPKPVQTNGRDYSAAPTSSDLQQHCDCCWEGVPAAMAAIEEIKFEENRKIRQAHGPFLLHSTPVEEGQEEPVAAAEPPRSRR